MLSNDKLEARGCTAENEEMPSYSIFDNSDTVVGKDKGEKSLHKTSKRQQEDTSCTFMCPLCVVLFRHIF